MERIVVLEILDEAWKNHLLVMDHLKDSIGLRGYAQIDPKVEYKREGMKTFEEMWNSVRQRVTDAVFHVEDLPVNFVGSTWKESQAIKEERRQRQPDRRAAAGGHRRHPVREEARADPQPPAPRGPQRSLPLRQRQEVQTLPRKRRGGVKAGPCGSRCKT